MEQNRGGTISYYMLDGQGNVRALTNGSGTITDRYTYNAYGTVYTSPGTTTNSYLYTGQQYDSLTALYDLRARYYNPGTGDFLTRDTAGTSLSDPRQLNRYDYVVDNPINFEDPTGHQDIPEYAILLPRSYYVAQGLAFLASGLLAIDLLNGVFARQSATTWDAVQQAEDVAVLIRLLQQPSLSTKSE